MEFLIDILLQIFGEVILQIIFELLFELGLHSLIEPFRKPPNPWLAALGYVLLGAIAGALSLWAFPRLFIQSHVFQIVNLLLTPCIAGATMAALGSWRRRRRQTLIRLDKFVYGFVFALAMATLRFAFAD